MTAQANVPETYAINVSTMDALGAYTINASTMTTPGAYVKDAHSGLRSELLEAITDACALTTGWAVKM